MMPSRTNLATGIPSSKVKYSRLVQMRATLTFRQKLTAKAGRLWESSFFPDVMRSNLLNAVFLIGAFLIIIGSLLLAGYISKGGPAGPVPVLIIGTLVFLPGFYHLHIAYYASKGYREYSYDDIPDFHD
ncbi:hypothetical protein FD755_022246 [Muntiacus reevesi]|uniref:Transmembrane protein 230 n=1 Tax=Muntiacus reevesi TaxID=9886 RepID=A0A5N3VZG7_MUNRE|nr:hypothetical protein FD755_022246 [Muntiacus reevesi]